MSGALLIGGVFLFLIIIIVVIVMFAMGGETKKGPSPSPSPSPAPAPVDILYDEKVMPYPAGGSTELGAGTSVAACRTLAKAGNHKNFGYRKEAAGNSCWAYNVPSELIGQTPNNNPNDLVGCVDPSKDITRGCV